jgi:hypothetical protein
VVGLRPRDRVGIRTRITLNVEATSENGLNCQDENSYTG